MRVTRTEDGLHSALFDYERTGLDYERAGRPMDIDDQEGAFADSGDGLLGADAGILSLDVGPDFRASANAQIIDGRTSAARRSG